MKRERASIETIELDLLLEGIYRQYGFDFRQYSRSFLERRLRHRAKMERRTIIGLLESVLQDPECFNRVLLDLSINVTDMFRDPSFFQALRIEIAPLLNRLPHIRVWHAGCSTGEEVLSMAILLYEEGLYEKSRIYATDINEQWLNQARLYSTPLGRVHEYSHSYLQSGGNQPFSNYYTAEAGHAFFHPWLMDHVHFFQHNLATDSPFDEFDLILCRNVMIYFNKDLQRRVHRIFCDSLANGGFLALGRRETLEFSGFISRYEIISRQERLYRKR